MDEIQFPTWKSVGLPSNFVRVISNAEHRWLDFLILNRVFRQPVKSKFTYSCRSCGRGKNIYRIYEDYSRCDRCHSFLISCQPSWNFYRNDVRHYSEDSDNYVSSVIARMQQNFIMYFQMSPSDDFINFVPKFSQNREAVFTAKFICGDAVCDNKPGIAILKASVLCPFLWDDAYDWKNEYFRDESLQSHITPMIKQMIKWGYSENPEGYSIHPIQQMAEVDGLDMAAEDEGGF